MEIKALEKIVKLPGKGTIITITSVAGGSVSAGLGAGGGLLIGGPVGAGVGWLLGIVAGTISAALYTNKALSNNVKKQF